MEEKVATNNINSFAGMDQSDPQISYECVRQDKPQLLSNLIKYGFYVPRYITLIAAYIGSTKCLKTLHRVNGGRFYWGTLLYAHAIHGGHLQTVKFIESTGLPLENKYRNCVRNYSIAMYMLHKELDIGYNCIFDILSKGSICDIMRIKDRLNERCVKYICEQNRHTILKHILDNNITNILSHISDIIRSCVIYGSVDCLKIIVEKYGLTEAHRNKITYLFYHLFTGKHIKMYKYIHDELDIQSTSNDNDYVIASGGIEMLKYHLNKYPNSNIDIALTGAANDWECFEYLLHMGARLQQRTFCSILSQTKNKKVLEYLMSHIPNQSTLTKEINYAAKHGLEIFKQFVNMGLRNYIDFRHILSIDAVDILEYLYNMGHMIHPQYITNSINIGEKCAKFLINRGGYEFRQDAIVNFNFELFKYAVDNMHEIVWNNFINSLLFKPKHFEYVVINHPHTITLTTQQLKQEIIRSESFVNYIYGQLYYDMTFIEEELNVGQTYGTTLNVGQYVYFDNPNNVIFHNELFGTYYNDECEEEFMRYLYDNECEADEKSMLIAISNDKNKVLEFLHKKMKVPLNSLYIYHAKKYGSTKCLKYLEENDCPNLF